jgi:oligoribonuclease
VSDRPQDKIVWIDCEMTGLDLQRDALIEVAVLVTDEELNILGDGIDVVIASPAAALETMPDIVREMHTSSGLLDELAAGLTMAEAQDKVMAYIREFVPEAGKAPLGGNSVATDRGFLARDMPELDAWLHYRMVDVSSIKELARRWYPRVYFNAPKKHGGHRFWRAAIFVPPPGPDSDAARALAATYEVVPADPGAPEHPA